MLRTRTVFIVAFLLCSLIAFIAVSFRDQYEEKLTLKNQQITKLTEKQKELRDSIDAVWHLEMQLLCEFKDPKTHDFFVFWKIGSGESVGYSYATTLKIKKSDLDYVLNITRKHEVEWMFTLQTLWIESRFATNMNHKVNYDGSKDGGPFGINSRYKATHMTGNMREDVLDYVVYYDRFIDPFPRSEWRVRYQYGDRKAMELGLISSGGGN